MVKRQQQNSTRSSARKLCAAAGVDQLILLTDSKRLPDPVVAVKWLPPASMVILRDYDSAERLALAIKLRRACRKADCWFLVAGDAQLAYRVRADGLHLPEHMLTGKRAQRRGFQFITAACHSRRALRLAASAGVDLALVSPVFATASHPDAAALGTRGLSRMIARAKIPVAALGGIDHRTAKSLRGQNIKAIAAISALKI